MSRIFPSTEIVIQGTFKNSSGTLTNPTTLKFYWRVDAGSETEVTPSNVSTGLYNATFTPTKGGTLYIRWEATTPTVTEEKKYPISHSNFAAHQ